MTEKIFPIVSQPGIRRDNTGFSSKYYTDGQWVRFQQGLPRKVGGFRQLIGTLPNIVRGLIIVPNGSTFNAYIGDYASLKMLPFDQDGNVLGPLVDITPAGFPVNIANEWQFDVMWSTVANNSIIIAHAAPNLASINSQIETPVYYGITNATVPLIPTGQSVSGGIVVLHPYLVYFSNNGDVRVSNINDPTTIFQTTRVTASKIVYGLPTRGGTNSPAGLLWSLDAVIRITFSPNNVGGVFTFDTITSQSSILSSRSVIEYDGLYFWAAIDKFLVYTGTVQELPNQMNLNYFFLNLNYDQRQKVWATKVPQYGEIWFHFPMNGNTECNAAVIYNKRENTWYDTILGRGAGYFEQVFADPIWSDTVAGNAGYGLWIHEVGVDQNINGTLTAIDSYFETGAISLAGVGPSGQWTGTNRWSDLYRFEPDFVQTGNMTLTVSGKEYARSTAQASSPYTFGPTTLKIDLREQRREMTLRFESNTVGGFYWMGQCLLALRIGDASDQ